jgi:hypothetical protein
MLTPRLPGLAGELEDFFSSMPGMDHGLARAAALVVMDWAANDRCRIRAPWFGADGGDLHHPELWPPAGLFVFALASNASLEAMITAVNRLLAAVDPEGASVRPPVLPTDAHSPEVLVVWCNREITGPGSPHSEPSPDLVTRVREIRDRAGTIVHLTEGALTYARRYGLEYGPRDACRVPRWMNVCAMLALEDGRIDAEIAVLAGELVAEHEKGMSEIASKYPPQFVPVH